MPKNNRRKAPRLPPEELAVLSVMADYPLQAGQMLLLGPQSVKLLQDGGFAGKLPDKVIYEKIEWKREDCCVRSRPSVGEGRANMTPELRRRLDWALTVYRNSRVQHEATIHNILVECNDALSSTAGQEWREPEAERATIIEQCAKVAETYDMDGAFKDDMLPKGWRGCRRQIAVAIRALSAAPPVAEPPTE